MAAEYDVHPLYLAMTRPPMVWGVPMMYVGMTGCATFLVFIWTKWLSSLLLMPLLHAAGYWMIQRDPRFLDIWMTWSKFCGKCQTRRRFGCNIYLGG